MPEVPAFTLRIKPYPLGGGDTVGRLGSTKIRLRLTTRLMTRITIRLTIRITTRVDEVHDKDHPIDERLGGRPHA